MRSILHLWSRQSILTAFIACYFVIFLASCSNSNNSDNEIRVPQNILANAGSREVELSWQGIPGASSYTVYWQVGKGVLGKEAAFTQTTPKPYFVHTNLSNGVTYYYRVSAHTSKGESKLSAQVQATPKQLPPEKPLLKQTGQEGLQAYPGDSEVTLVWPETVSLGAVRYSILWRLSGSDGDYQRVDDVVSPFVQQGLINGRTYSFRLLGVNDEGESTPSDELLATPMQNPPAAPKNLSAIVQPGSATLSWDDISNAQTFEIYWSTTSGVSLNDNHVDGVRSPFTHAPLLSGQTYYYRVRALNQGGASALSGELSLTPPDANSPVYAPLPAPALIAPQISQVAVNDSRLTISWSAVPNATGYNLYWNNTGSVTTADNKIANIAVMRDEGSNELRYVHTGLINGKDYYYRIAAFNDGDGQDDEVLSPEVGPRTPERIIPGSPANVRAIGGDGWAGVRWDPVQNAAGYKLYWKETNGANEYAVDPVESPYTLNGLANGTEYEIQISAVDLSGIEKRSNAVKVTPQIDQPTAPQGVTVTPGNQQVLIQWNSNPPGQAVTHYHVYFGAGPGIKPDINNTPRVDVDAGTTETRIIHSQPPLTNGRRYYYVVTAVNAGGESLPSKELWAIPSVPAPGAPTQISAKAGNATIELSWQPPSETIDGQNLAYNIYWQSDAGDGRSNVVVIPNVSSPYSFLNLTNGANYYFKVSAANAGGEGVFSPEVTATPFLPPPSFAPSIDNIQAGDAQVSLSWSDPNALAELTVDSYTIFWSTSPQIDLVYGPRIEGLKQTSYVHQGLNNGMTYFYLVIAVNQGGQSPVSAMNFAQPQVAPPSQAPANFTVLAGDRQVSYRWDPVSGAANYVLYWSADPNRPLAQWAAVQGASSGNTQSNLQNGTRYYYYLRAVNAGGQGPLSNLVSAMPQEPPPAVPTGVSATAGDGQTVVNWTAQPGLTYHLYWSTSPGVSTASQHFDNVQAAYVHTGLNNDTGPYYYRLQAENAGGFSALSLEVSADPAPPVSGAPVGLSAQARNGQVLLNWLPPAGAGANTVYTLYWYLDPNNPASRTAIPNVRSPFIHGNLNNGTTYYYVITANNGGGESPPSAPALARPMPDTVNAPSALQAVAGQTQVSLQWNAVSGADRYYVYVSTSQTSFDPANRASVNVPDTQYTFTGLIADTTYYFYVTAENLSGESSPSHTVSATTAAPNQIPVIAQGTLISRNIGIGGTTAVTLNANDSDGDPLTWRLSQAPLQGSATFDVTAGNDVLLTYQHTATVSTQDAFWVEVSDSHGGVDSVQIVITASNQAPVFDAAVPDQVSLNENTPNTSVIMTIKANDSDGDVLTYALGSGVDVSLFTLDGQTGELRFVNSPNYDIPADAGGDNHYQVPVVVDDGKGAANSKVSKIFIVAVNNVNEPPSIISNPVTAATEGQPYSYALQISDEDLLLSGDTFTYVLVNAPAGMTVDANGVIYWTPDNSAVAGNPHAVQVQVSDSGNLTANQSFSIQVAAANPPANTPPVINSSANQSVAENSVDAATITGVDPDSANIDYRISGGTDSAAFYLVPGDLPNTATLRFIRPPDYEIPSDAGGDNVYDVQVTANDGLLDSLPQDIQVTVTNVAVENSLLGVFADAKLQTCINEQATLNDWKYTYQVSGTISCAGKGITNLSGMEQLNNLEGINLQGNSITDVTPLTGLTKLKEVSLASNNLSSLAEPNFTGIAGLDNVSILWLENNSIADFSPLTGMANLQELIIWNNNISDLSASNIASLTSLSRLWLQQNPINDVSALAAFPNLLNLGLSQLGLSLTSPADIAGLSSLTHLKILWMENNGLTSTSGLQNLVNLQELYLFGNQIRDVSNLAGITTLTTLDLGSNGLTSAGLVTGLSSLGSLTALGLYGNTLTELAALNNPNFQSHLTDLYLANNQLTDISALASLSNLRYLDLNQNTTLVDLSPLSPLNNLTDLYLGLTAVSDLSAINGKTSIKRFGTAYLHSIQDYSPIATLTNLEELYLNDAGIDDQDMAALTNLTHLKKLYLEGINSFFTDASALANLKSLEVLDLSSNKIMDISVLSNLQKLNYLSLYNNQIADTTPLRSLYGLKQLYLSSNNIVDVTILSAFTGLSELDLSSNQITDVSPLAGLKQLNKLRLDSNQINSTGNGNVDTLTSFISPSVISLYNNPTIDCTRLQTLINAYPQGVVLPETLDPTRYCTDFAALHSTATFTSNLPNPTAGDTITITVLAYDKTGNPKTTGGDSVVITSQFVSANLPGGTLLQVSDNGDGTYTATYSTYTAGQDGFLITINGAPIGPKDVTDANGILNGVLTIDVIANQQPVAIISQPAANVSVDLNQPLVFDASTSFDPDGHTPLSYSWTFSNGTTVLTSNAATPTMSFSEGGNYSAQLVVTDSLGLNSQVAGTSFTVGVPLAGLFSADTNLQNCVNATGYVYTYQVGSLDCSNQNITNLSGIENLTRLSSLWMINNPGLTDLTPLSNAALSQLRGLYLSNNTATNNISLNQALANLVNLTELRIDNTGITDISGLSNLTVLSMLNISNDPIADFTVLSGANMITLTSLVMSNSGFSNTVLLSGMVNLITLTADGNQITDVAPIGNNLLKLTALNLRANLIGGLSVGHLDSLVNFTNPLYIYLTENPTASCSEMNKVIFTYNQTTQTVSPTKPSPGSSCTIDALETLNDTGETQCTDTVSGLPCPVTGYPGQDAEFGRDPPAINDNANGLAGFTFTKLDAAGAPLPATATAWSCVRDEATGFVWEVKTANGSMHDGSNTYTWYDPNNQTNGGGAGDSSGAAASCTGSACYTKALVDAVNAANFCGFSDWRVPNVPELQSIVDYGVQAPALDAGFFPNINTGLYYWTSNTWSNQSGSATEISLNTGSSSLFSKTTGLAVMLVRGMQKQ